MDLVLRHLPATIELAVAALVITVLIALPAAVVSAVYRGSTFDYLLRVSALAGQSMPGYWLGMILILVFAVQLRLLPTSGRGTLAHLLMPSLTLAAYFVALLARMTRSVLLEVLEEDYVRTARAKGLAQGGVVLRHALSNALIPVTTLLGLQIGTVLGGAVITEAVCLAGNRKPRHSGDLQPGLSPGAGYRADQRGDLRRHQLLSRCAVLLPRSSHPAERVRAIGLRGRPGADRSGRPPIGPPAAVEHAPGAAGRRDPRPARRPERGAGAAHRSGRSARCRHTVPAPPADVVTRGRKAVPDRRRRAGTGRPQPHPLRRADLALCRADVGTNRRAGRCRPGPGLGVSRRAL